MRPQSLLVLGTALCAAAAPMYQILPQIGQPLEVQAFSEMSRIEKRGIALDFISKIGQYMAGGVRPLGATHPLGPNHGHHTKRESTKSAEDAEVNLSELTPSELEFFEKESPEYVSLESDISEYEDPEDSENLRVDLSTEEVDALAEAIVESELPEEMGSMPGAIKGMFKWWLKTIDIPRMVGIAKNSS